MDLKVAGQFAVNDCRVGLPAKTVGISRIALTDGDVFLNTQRRALPPKKRLGDSAAGLPWQIDVGKLTVANLVFGMRTAPAVPTSVRLPDGRWIAAGFCWTAGRYPKSILLNRGGYAYLTAPADAGEKAPDKTAVPDKRTASNKTTARSKAAPSDKTATQGKAAHPDKTAAADNASSPHDAAADDGEAPALPWTVRVGSIALNDNSLEYGTLHHAPRRDSIRRSSSSRRSTCRRFDLQPGRRHRPSDPPAGVHRTQRVVRTECRRSALQWTPPAFRSPGSNL